MNKELSYLTSLFGASGSEGDVRQAILNELRAYCDQVDTDRMGNVIAFKRGLSEPPYTVMLAAHMDEIALVVTHIDESGYLRFGAMGAVDPRTLPGKHVVIGRKKYHGVIGILPPHLVKRKDSDVQKIEDLFIDIGAGDRADAEALVALGDRIGFDTDYREFGEGLVAAKGLDDRAGCHILLELIKKDLPFDTWFVFFSLGEIGGALGLKTAAFSVKPQLAFLVQGAASADFAEAGEQGCLLGKGPAISFMDHAAVYDRALYQLAFRAANNAGIPVQANRSVEGMNENGTLASALNGCRCLAVSFPCRYIHSAVSVASLADIENTALLLEKILREIANGGYNE